MHKVYLVDDQQDRDCLFGHFGQEGGIFFGALHHVGDVYQDVGIGEGAFALAQHRLLQFVLGREDAGGVREDNLVVGGVDDAHDAVACGLGLGGYDGHALAYEVVHQCRLADVGVAYDVDETGAVPGVGC